MTNEVIRKGMKRALTHKLRVESEGMKLFFGGHDDFGGIKIDFYAPDPVMLPPKFFVIQFVSP